MTNLSIPITSGRSLLRGALVLDALVTGANGAVYLVAAGPLEDLLGVSAAWLRGAGAILLAFAAVVWAASRGPAARAVPAIVAVNALWALASVALAIAGWQDPTTAGTVWIVLQAIVVAGFAELQTIGLRGAVLQ
jgi:hypothetical protein